MSLIELLTAMVLLAIVMVGITTAFVSGIKAEADLAHRFDAQQSVRAGLGRFRTDLHCASAVTPTSGATNTVTLTIPTGCNAAASGSVTWCTTAGTSGYDLWRIPAATCTTSTAGSIRLARGIVTQSVFTPDATTHAGAPVLPSVAVSLAVTSGGRRYTAADTIYLRNGTRQ